MVAHATVPMFERLVTDGAAAAGEERRPFDLGDPWIHSLHYVRRIAVIDPVDDGGASVSEIVSGVLRDFVRSER